MNDVFEKKYKSLNAEQKQAVDAIEGPVMVIAGPGTGKTQILTLRIANILRKTDTPASGILAITYTESGVRAMRTRLREIIGARADEVRIHTFHGLAASIISEFDDHFPHLHKAAQMTDAQAENIVRKILEEKRFAKLRPLGDAEFYVGKIISTVSEAKREAWTPEMIKAFAEEEIERVKNDDDSISSRGATKGKLKGEALKRIEKCERTMLFADAYARYEERKKEERKMDFDDLIGELILALKNDRLLLQLLQEKFLYTLVDEHQDTNDSQNLIVKMLADFFDEPNLFVVGDEKQAIYRFQGASVENFLRFEKMWPSMKTIRLKNNYRSHQKILDAVFSMIENNYAEGENERLRVKLVSQNGETRPIEIIKAGNVEAEEKRLVENIKAFLEEKTDETAAVILRRNKDAAAVIDLLENAGIPFSSERGADIFSHPLGSLFFDLAEWLSDPARTESLARTIAGGLWNISFAEGGALIREIKNGAFENLEEKIPVVKDVRREMRQPSPVYALMRIAELSGLRDAAARDPLSVEVWRGIVALAEDIVARNSLEDPEKLFSELVTYRLSGESKRVKVPIGPLDAKIAVMTAHASKGQEFDRVFIPYAVEETWMTRARGSYFVLPREKEDRDEIRDARRLLYVAMTRAKKHLSISYSVRGGSDKEFAPLRFLAELDQKAIASTELPEVREKEARIAVPSKEKTVQEYAEYAKKTLLESGLSVTALNRFISCPREFFYESILKIPQKPSASAEKGNAMHEAIDRVWRLEKKDEKNIEKTIKDAVGDYFSVHSRLPKFEKEQIVSELTESAPLVAKALQGHFAAAGEIKSETWAEKRFEFSFEGSPISIKIHGKLDAVVETDEEISIFDYKTRSAMSIKEMKGETKDSDGDYFRQLVFYRLLLEGKNVKRISPALVFVKPDDKGRCPIVAPVIEASDVENLKKEIEKLIVAVWSGEFLSKKCDDPDCASCALFEVIQ